MHRVDEGGEQDQYAGPSPESDAPAAIEPIAEQTVRKPPIANHFEGSEHRHTENQRVKHVVSHLVIEQKATVAGGERSTRVAKLIPLRGRAVPCSPEGPRADVVGQ